MTDAWKPTPGRDAMTRDGRRVTELKKRNIEDQYRLIGYDGRDWRTWTEDGRYIIAPHPLDLVRDADPLPDADGWVPHNGGDCPVPPDTMLEVRFRDNDTSGPECAYGWHWGEMGESTIVAYRIVKPASTAIPSPVRMKTVPEIVLGDYGIVRVSAPLQGDRCIGIVIDEGLYTAAELTDAINTLTAVRDAMEVVE